MAKYVAKRFVSMLITLFLVATVTFFLMHAVPGQPFEITRETPDSVKEALYEQHGLNKPLFEQYLIYMKNLLHGDFGVSMKYKSQTVDGNVTPVCRFLPSRFGGVTDQVSVGSVLVLCCIKE